VRNFDETGKISIVANRDAARAGTKTGDMWALVKNGATVGDFLKAYGKTKYAKTEPGSGFLAYFVRAGNIKISGSTPAAKPKPKAKVKPKAKAAA
jgi:hypothetical protein